MKANRRSIRSRRGFAALYVTITSLLLVPMVGLVIDLGIMYNVKAKLQAAVDAAAIGSGTMLQRSTDIGNSTTIANVKDAAQRFFNANFPSTYWGTTRLYYDATLSEDTSTKVRSIYVHAGVSVPMLFLRMLHISNSTVAAEATVNVRFVTMMIVVDRSGSVQRAGNDTNVKNALNTFVVATPTSTPPGQSVFADGRDIIGMVSFGGTWNLDFAPVANFRSASPNIGTAVNNLPFGNSATNTAEGLYQAYTGLQALNQTGALNIIVLLTDGRPSAFTGTFNLKNNPCTNKDDTTGFISANVGQAWPPLPPQTWGGLQDASTQIWSFGLFEPHFTGLSGGTDAIFVANSNGCHYYADSGQPIPGADMYLDITNFPKEDVHGNSTTGPVFQGEGRKLSDPRAVRFASVNAADNMATTIRQDTTIRPILFVIGLNNPPSGGEPLDADWLARVANDPKYKDSFGNSVFQSDQTSGMYYNVDGAGLVAAFQNIASQILRLSQ
jgi:Flp pilus assembly protein TadG